MMFGDQTDESVAREILAHARDHDVNFIDTADVYSKGKSESMVGTLIESQRDDWVLATKVGNKMSERPNESQYSRTWVLRECDASLKRLATDRIDIYY
ncbi:MAG: aldo/keto reductase, partial [Burkholderiaceae bacterium]